MNNVAAALIPPVSEKKSIERPRKKLKSKSEVFSFLRGK
tara:strand:+ start:258 stop:374 length:117 start_codon:yes stop_codon:yes gene_type:complete